MESSDPFLTFSPRGALRNKLTYIQQERLRLDTVLSKTNRNPSNTSRGWNSRWTRYPKPHLG